jgi:DNA-binding SARP family transcriptional activator
MSILHVTLFGGVHVTHDNWSTEVIMTREIQALLAYLLLQRHRQHSREVLADMFWGEYNQTKARRSLNTALWKLKKVLEPREIASGTYLKNSRSGEIGFNKTSEYWLDVEVFENEINRALSCPVQAVQKSHLLDLERALRLYQGDLLEGVYEDWALRERERMRALYSRSLFYLSQYHEFCGAYDKAIAYGQQILDLDPIREEIHREMMRLYMANGQRTLAVRQYEICRSVLAKELGISPMPDTESLSRQIIAGDQLVASKSEHTGFAEAIQQLDDVGRTIDLAREQIQKVRQWIIEHSE